MIYHVLSNLNHNGESHLKGEVFESDENFNTLVSDGVLEVIDAKTIAEAQKILAEVKPEPVKEEEKALEPENTWGPKPDKAPEDEIKPEPVLKKYKVLYEKGVVIPGSDEVHAQGTELILNVESPEAIHFTQGGFIEEVVDAPKSADAPALPEDAGANL